MKKADRQEFIETIKDEIDYVLSERTDSYERSIEDLEEIQRHINIVIDGLRDDIKQRDGK